MAFAPVAKFVSGAPTMVDITPSGALTAGDVTVIGGHLRIAHNDIAASTLGSAAAGGDALYDFIRNASDTFTDGATIYFNSTTNKATSLSATNGTYNLGVVIGAQAATTNTTVRVQILAVL